MSSTLRDRLRPVFAIARNTFAQGLHARVYSIVLFYAIAQVFFLAITAQGESAFRDRLAIDAGLAMVRLFGLILVIFTTLPLFATERERHTLHAMLAMNLGRGTIVIGLYLGVVAILTAVYLIMTAIFAALITLAGFDVTVLILRCLLLVFWELTVLAAVTLCCSVIGGFFVALLLTLFAYALGNLTFSVHFFLDETGSGPLFWLVATIYYLLPNFGLFDLKDIALSQHGFPWDYDLTAAVYALALVVVINLIAVTIAERNDIEG